MIAESGHRFQGARACQAPVPIQRGFSAPLSVQAHAAGTQAKPAVEQAMPLPVRVQIRHPSLAVRHVALLWRKRAGEPSAPFGLIGPGPMPSARAGAAKSSSAAATSRPASLTASPSTRA
jgi:hypothetical protein